MLKNNLKKFDLSKIYRYYNQLFQVLEENGLPQAT
jgi:hypothetical protein